MALLSPSVVRMEQPLDECARILNILGCQSVHVDMCQGSVFPGFFNLSDMQTDSLRVFNACVTAHIFRLLDTQSTINLSMLRDNDLVVFHMFPHITTRDLAAFFEAAKTSKCKLGLSLDLGVPLTSVTPFLEMVDTVFIMGIPVATHGLQPDQSTVARLDEMRKLINRHNPSCRLGIDGGVNANTFYQMVGLVDELVVGGLLLNTDDISSQWSSLQSIAGGG